MSKNSITGLPLFKRGKVRDVYDLGSHLLMVSTDRISCFDAVLPTEIPGKGKVLTALSAYWFQVMTDIAPHHLLITEVAQFPSVCHRYTEELEGRSMLVKKAAPAPVECIVYVRDYLLSLNWDTRPPVPTLPPEVVQKTQEKYLEALRRLTASPARCFGR